MRKMNEKEKEIEEQNGLILPKTDIEANTTHKGAREKWGKEIEFLLSCIALSVGLGNVWRFPFTALQNGGGAFVIPYIIVLLLIGRPVYYMEVVIGQFSSKGCPKAYDFSPIMRGVGYGQLYATAMATTYYATIMGLTLRYLIASFNDILPWAYCRERWGSNCLNASNVDYSKVHNTTTGGVSSAEYYFLRNILKEKDSIDDGLGTPNWDLVGCLALSWTIIATILIKGIKSSGKASYFLAIFPYIVMTILLARAVTLPGALDGIIYFLKPQWNQLLNPKVWYAAITQVFFSLVICFGTLIMYASYNNFSRNIQKDVMIITTIDTFTSMLAGCIIFGILGNLAYETNSSDISKVVKGGAGLAFISYPDAIAKFQFMPQIFAFLFFLMLFVLGIGSNVGMASCIIAAIRDRFTHLKLWTVVVAISFIGFLLGITYTTPGGQFILNLVDFFGCSFIALILAVVELLAVGWVYGVKRLCMDIEFMFGIKTGAYWRICWGIISPGIMAVVLIYTLIEYEPLTYNNLTYPTEAYVFGWIVTIIGVLLFPAWAIYIIYQQDSKLSFTQRFKAALKPHGEWGPQDPDNYKRYIAFKSSWETNIKRTFKEKIIDNLFG